jgi:uncharacterized protein (TIGR02001 family)
VKLAHIKFLTSLHILFLFALAGNAAQAKGVAVDSSDEDAFNANLTLNSNWVWRGLAQSDYKPAIQGGFEYADKSGFYIGNWNSTARWVSDGGYAQHAPVEIDLYAGLKREWIAKDFATDIGLILYAYPTSGINPGYTNPNTAEVYISQEFDFGPVDGTAKLFYAISNTFGIAKSVGSYYLELNVNYETGFFGIVLNSHVGYQKINGQSYEAGQPSYSYADWLFGISKDLGEGFYFSAAYVGTNVKKGSGAFSNTYAYSTSTGGNAGGNTVFVLLTKAF